MVELVIYIAVVQNYLKMGGLYTVLIDRGDGNYLPLTELLNRDTLPNAVKGFLVRMV